MSKSKKMWLVIATSLVFFGMAMFVIVMSVNEWDFSKLNTAKYETNTYQISEEFSNISIKTIRTDIDFEISEDGKCSVVAYEQEKVTHSVEVIGDTLTITVNDQREWYEHFGIAINSPKVTIYLPARDYASAIKVKTTTGDISVEDMSIDSLDVSITTGKVNISNLVCKKSINLDVTTGKVKVSDTECERFTSEGSIGDIILKKVIVEDMLSIERDTGDIEFYNCDAEEIDIEADTGDITGSLLTDKKFIAETDTGKIDVPKSGTGGICKLETDTGDIEVSISN